MGLRARRGRPSTGPPLIEAEDRFCPAAGAAKPLLQRGRLSSRRRTFLDMTCRIGTHAFNGAASHRGGGQRHPRVLGRELLPSTGPPLIEAEDDALVLLSREQDAPSTGPPLIEAEDMRFTSTLTQALAVLQRGRLSSRRRTATAPPAWLYGPPPSTGPPLIEAEDKPCRPNPYTSNMPSTGPPLIEAEDRCVVQAVRSQARPSTGPPLIEAEDVQFHHRDLRGYEYLQRGRLSSRRRTVPSASR